MMELHRLDERAHLAQIMLEVMLTVLRGRFGANRGSLNGEIEMLLMTSVVLIANASGKGRTAAQIGRVLGIPRVTVRRKLQTLVERGALVRKGNSYWIVDTKVKSFRYLDTAQEIIARGAKKRPN